jgi:hypothetical protein
VDFHFHHHYSLDEVKVTLDLIIKNQEKIMTALTDLQAAVAALITEESADIAALVAQINAQTSNDPAVVALTKQVTDATAAAHAAFTSATGQPLPVPPPTPSA